MFADVAAGTGVFVGVAVGTGVFVGIGTGVFVGVAVGTGVFIGTGVLVGTGGFVGVAVGTGVFVGKTTNFGISSSRLLWHTVQVYVLIPILEVVASFVITPASQVCVCSVSPEPPYVSS